MASVEVEKGTRIAGDWRTGAQAVNMMGSDYKNAQAASDTHVGILDYYMPKFYQLARGHVVNKYHVGLYGPYVDEALRVMDQNSFADKYDLGRKKPFPGTTDNFRKSIFDKWLEMCYEPKSGVLNMFWAAKSVNIATPTATTANAMMDTTKQIHYPVVTGISCDNTMQIEVTDDPYLMWYNFFNALFNVQFSPLLLKPRSTLQKINVMVELLTEGITEGNSRRSIEERGASPMNNCMTDLVIGQMFEFNSCITIQAPSININYENSNPYTFQVQLKYPNAYQGTFKDQMRYLRDNTTRGIDPSKSLEYENTGCQQTLTNVDWCPYGDYNIGFYEVDHGTWQAAYNNATFEAYQPKMYQKYINSGASAKELRGNFKYNMHGQRRS
jgi:hypothetical protein